MAHVGDVVRQGRTHSRNGSHDKTRCSLDGAGEPIMDEDSLTCVRETYTNTFELYAFTVNFGITISP